MSDSTFKDMTDIINERMLLELKELDIPDTTENRISFLQGLRDGWEEENGDDIDALPWITAASFEIVRLSIKNVRELLGILD